MTNSPIPPPPNNHAVHTDPVDAAIALLTDVSLAGELVCDGSCNGVASCTIAGVVPLAVAA